MKVGTPAILFLNLMLLGSLTTAAEKSKSPPQNSIQENALGPLRINPDNPRWLVKPSGEAVLLAGSHVWWNLQDNNLLMAKGGNPPPVFDYPGYLDFLERYNHNFFRLWRWELTQWTGRQWNDLYPPDQLKSCRPHPWIRTGPVYANDGQPRFDLTQFNQAYFDRLRARVRMAGERGIYCSIMLFEGWGAQFLENGWDYHPFNLHNNVNGIDADSKGYYMLQRTEMGGRILDLQEEYVRKIVDTVNDLDNVLYEVVNEAGPYSTEWQYHIILYVKRYQKTKPQQHPVGMTFQYSGGLNSTLFESPADWISPNPNTSAGNYRTDPSPESHGKVIISDTDHLWGHTGGDALWVWKSYTRGLNTLFMEELIPSPTWHDSAREAMGQVRRYAEIVQLKRMIPWGKLSSTGYCLANPGEEYLIFHPGSPGLFSVDLSEASGTCSVEWLEIETDTAHPRGTVTGGNRKTFQTPFGGAALLYLNCKALN